MRWEAEQHVPFDMESVELDFQILDPDADGLEMSVLLVAAKRELIESKVRMLTDAGLEPAVVDVEAFALHNAFEINHPDAMNGVVGLLNIGHDVTNINILDDGVPLLTRDLTVGTRRFREDLQRERGLGADDAQSAAAGLRSIAAPRCGHRERAAKRSPSASSAPPRFSRRTRAPARCARSTRAAAARAFRASTTCSPTRLRLTVQQANPLANLKVRDGALASLVTDEIAPLLDAPNRSGAPAGRMIEINLLPGAGQQEGDASPRRSTSAHSPPASPVAFATSSSSVRSSPSS